MPHSVLLLCDEPLWARSAKEILESRGFSVSAPLLTKSHPLDVLRSENWEVCLLSICQRHWNGIEILKVARIEFPSRRILYFYSDADPMEGTVALGMGANDTLSKCLPEADLLALFSHAGETASDSTALTPGGDRTVNKQPFLHGRSYLSMREKQILGLISQGMTYRDIASLTNLSLSTVNTYRRRLIEKMGVRNGRELLIYAMKSDGLEGE